MRVTGTRIGAIAAVVAIALLGDSTDAAAKTTLRGGEQLKCGQSLKSTNGYFRFVFQCDGNLVLYDKPSGVLWNAVTQGKGGKTLIQQADGNLVLYADNRPVWNSATHGHPGAILRMQEDGNLVIYDGGTPVWASRTSANCDAPEVCLYDGSAASGWGGVHDTTATTIDDYAKMGRHFHNGKGLNNRSSSIHNNSDYRICFFDQPRFAGASVCVPAHSKTSALGGLDNKISSHTVVEPGCAVGVELEAGSPGYVLVGRADRRFGTAQLIYGLRNAAADWAGAVKPGGFGPLAIGEISQRCGGDISGHASHECGTDVDIGPLRLYPHYGFQDYFSDPYYSADATYFFIHASRPHLSTIRVFFNDPRLYQDALINWEENHDNHFHARILAPPSVAECCRHQNCGP